MKGLLYFLILLCFVGRSNVVAQELKNPRQLKVGETTPNVLLNNVKNYPEQKAHLKDFVKGKKLLIIDFWNRGCSACIEFMPKVQELQRQFEADLQIVYALNPGDSAYYKVLAERIPNVRNLKLPSINGDSVLYKGLFPHRGDPYQIWLDADLKVLASSSHIHLTAINIQDYLNGDLDNFPYVGTDMFTSAYYNQSHRSLLDLRGGFFGKRMMGYGLFTRSIKNLTYGEDFFLTDSATGKKIGLKMVNKTVKGLYDWAKYAVGMDIKDVIMQTKDSAFHNIDKYARNASEYQYCYESNFGEGFKVNWQRKLLSDLDLQFQLKSAVEKIISNCLVISISDTAKFKKLKSRHKELVNEKGHTIVKGQAYVPDNGKGYVMERAVIQLLYGDLKKVYKKHYIIQDKSVHDFGAFYIDLKLSSQLDDLESLQKELLQHGISLKEEVRPLKFLVVRDAN